MASSNVLLQCLIGMQCNDFVIIAADQTETEGILVIKDDTDKIFEISDKIVMGMNGDVGDRVQFSELISKNMKLYHMKNGYQLQTAAVTHFTRQILVDSLQSGVPFIVNLLMAGSDDEEGVHLYILDFLASCIKVPFAAHGFGGLLSYSVLSTYYRPDLTELQAYEVLKLCISEIGKRLFMNLPTFRVKVVSQDGIKILPAISSNSE